MSGGAGYVLSRESVRRLIELALPNKELCDPTTGVDDVELGRIFSKMFKTQNYWFSMYRLLSAEC